MELSSCMQRACARFRGWPLLVQATFTHHFRKDNTVMSVPLSRFDLPHAESGGRITLTPASCVARYDPGERELIFDIAFEGDVEPLQIRTDADQLQRFLAEKNVEVARPAFGMSAKEMLASMRDALGNSNRVNVEMQEREIAAHVETTETREKGGA